MTYIVRSVDRGHGRRPVWEIVADHGDDTRPTYIGAHPTKRQAVTTARLLAGWANTVRIEV